jgi:pimeloyl-ACP methyl ester carboxylesterase
LAGLFGDEVAPGVTEFDAALPASPLAPTSLRDLMENLSGINGTPTSPQPDGAIMIQKVTAPDGTAHYIVYAPGTDDAVPWHHDETVRDMSTNFNLIAGNNTTYGAGILEAMRDAGISPQDPVMIVGHSQGGMQAINLLDHDSGFNITNVVTAGAPTSQEQIPVGSGINVLSFENNGDVVPLLNGEPNEATANHVTIQFDDSAVPGFEHDMDHYVNGAEAADASGNPDVGAQISSMAGFLNGTTTGIQAYVITR